MQWRVIVEVSGAVGAQQVHEVHAGGSATPGCSAATLGLSLAEAKTVLAGPQRHLVQAQAEEHCQIRRRCPRCGGQRPLKDRRPRQLRLLFGTVAVRAPRFEPCQCSVTLRTILSPVKEIMPDQWQTRTALPARLCARAEPRRTGVELRQAHRHGQEPTRLWRLSALTEAGHPAV